MVKAVLRIIQYSNTHIYNMRSSEMDGTYKSYFLTRPVCPHSEIRLDVQVHRLQELDMIAYHTREVPVKPMNMHSLSLEILHRQLGRGL